MYRIGFQFLTVSVSLAATAYAVPINSPPGDLALAGTGFSTSGSYDGNHTPVKLNDGNRDGIFEDKFSFHSDGVGPITFGVKNLTPTPVGVGEVILFNRTDACCGGRIDGSGSVPFLLTLLLGGNEVYSAKYTFTPDLTDAKISGMTIDFPKVVADTVEITQRNTDYVNIAEVEAYIPEPASLGLLGLGATGLLAHRRRR